MQSRSGTRNIKRFNKFSDEKKNQIEPKNNTALNNSNISINTDNTPNQNLVNRPVNGKPFIDRSNPISNVTKNNVPNQNVPNQNVPNKNISGQTTSNKNITSGNIISGNITNRNFPNQNVINQNTTGQNSNQNNISNTVAPNSQIIKEEYNNFFLKPSRNKSFSKNNISDENKLSTNQNFKKAKGVKIRKGFSFFTNSN
jgi:hypothetical protein